MTHKQIGDKKKEEKDSVLTREFTDTEMIMVRIRYFIDVHSTLPDCAGLELPIVCDVEIIEPM